MATQNVTLSKRYVMIASDTQNFFLSLPWLTGATIEVATSDTQTVPTVMGHELTGRETESINRTLIGPGFVYARSKSGTPLEVRLNVWTQ